MVLRLQSEISSKHLDCLLFTQKIGASHLPDLNNKIQEKLTLIKRKLNKLIKKKLNKLHDLNHKVHLIEALVDLALVDLALDLEMVLAQVQDTALTLETDLAQVLDTVPGPDTDLALAHLARLIGEQ